MLRAIPRHNVNLTSAELRLVLQGAMGRVSHPDGRIQFEANASRYFGAAHAIAVESGRTALHMALLGLDLGDGAVVVLPRYCFFSLVKVVEGMGYRARFAPVDPETFALDPTQLTHAMYGARAIVFIHPFGQLADVAGLQAVAAVHGVPLIEDASQATGARWGRHQAGAIGDVGVFSMVSGKNLQTFGGGFLVTQRDDVARRIQARLGADAGREDAQISQAFRAGLKRWFLTTPAGFQGLMHPATLALSTLAPAKLEDMLHEERCPYDPDRAIHRLSDAQGALGVMELGQLDRRNAIRRAHALRMLDGLQGIHGIHLPRFDPSAENSFNAVAVRSHWTPELVRGLRRAGFDTRTDYMEWFGDGRDFDEPVLYLPNHPGMTDADIDRLVAAVRRVLRHR